MDFKMVYRAKDGTTFDTKAEAEAYVKLMEAPHVKKLVERIEKLEQDVLAMKMDIATLHREPARPSWPQGPIAMLNNEAYNPATGGKL